MPRSQFDQELNKMHVDLDRMCHLVVLAIENCVTAFKEQDYELARDIIHGDKQINDVERSIEAKCLSLILKQQPVASDLRDVSTALKVVTDLERIGDQSADIAELILEMKEMDSFLMIGHIQDMAKIATKMVKESLDAFHQHDLKHALEVKKMDIKMDELFDQVKKDIIQMIKMTKQSLLMEYVKNIIQDFDWQLHLRNLSEEIEIMFQIINDQVNKVGDIEISYAMSDVWDMVQKSEVSGIDDTELSDKSNAELILILLNIVDNVLKNNPKKTLILFENLDHLVSLEEYIEIIHAAETISKKYDLYFIFSSSLNKYVCCDVDYLEGISVFGDVHFQMPEYNRLYLFLKENYPYEKEFSNEHVQEIICNIIQNIGQSNFLNTVEENVVCKLINQTLLLDDKIPDEKS